MGGLASLTKVRLCSLCRLNPAFQRWDRGQTCPSPGVTAEPTAFKASTGRIRNDTSPRVETLGYFRMSLRDRGARRASQILVAVHTSPLCAAQPPRYRYSETGLLSHGIPGSV